MKSEVKFKVMYQGWFLNCDKSTRELQDVNNGRKGEGSVGILRIIFATFM